MDATTITRRPRPAAITLTQSAEQRVASLMAPPPPRALGGQPPPPPAASPPAQGAEQRVAGLVAGAPADAIGVKLSTPRRGCSGLAYSVDYVTVEDQVDEKIETPGGPLHADGGAVLYLVGSVMDWV